jgi:tetratricopeptide (TPR) repeat protein
MTTDWKASAVLLLALWALSVGTARAEQDVGTALAPGDPPLTADMASRAQRFFEWSLGVQFTDEERGALRILLVDTWQTGDQDGIQGVLDILAYDEQVSALSDEERAAQREATETALLEQLRTEPEDGSAKWLLEVYDAAHKPIAEGSPPLTRQAADAQLEMLTFIMGEAAGQSGLRTDEATRESFAASLTAEYPKYPVERQAQIAGAPMAWASLRAGWAKADEEQRGAARKQWAADLKSQAGTAPEQSAAVAEQSPEQQAMSLLQAALEDLRAEKVRDAVEKIQAAIGAAPKLGAGYYLRGELWRVAEENDAALADLGKAIELEPGMVEAYDSRAQVYEAMREADRGKAASLRRAQEQPAEPDGEANGEASPGGYDAAAAKLQAQQQNFLVMSNILRVQHQTAMALISNKGVWGPTYRAY